MMPELEQALNIYSQRNSLTALTFKTTYSNLSLLAYQGQEALLFFFLVS